MHNTMVRRSLIDTVYTMHDLQQNCVVAEWEPHDL